MSQVNKYADKAGYTADKNRKDTQSAVSYVEDDGEVIYDGVNVVVDRDAADAGDLAVFDQDGRHAEVRQRRDTALRPAAAGTRSDGRGLRTPGRTGAHRRPAPSGFLQVGSGV